MWKTKYLIVLGIFLLIGIGGYFIMNNQTLDFRGINAQQLNGITEKQIYNIDTSRNLNIQRINIKDGFQLDYEDISCKVILSEPSDIVYKNYKDGIEWTNIVNVPTKTVSLSTSVDFTKPIYYNVSCNKDIIRNGNKIYIPKRDYTFEIDFSSLTKEYAKLESEESIAYSIKPQAYDLNYIDTKTLSLINVKLQEKYINEKDVLKSFTTSDYLYLDPTYTITNITTNAVLNNVQCEGGGYYCHLGINNSNLVLYYPFDVLNQSSAEYDWSSNNLDGTITGAGTRWQSTGKYGGSYIFESDGYITKSYNNLFKFNQTGFSITFWINTSDNVASSMGISRRSESTSNQRSLVIGLTINHKPYMLIYANGNSTEYTSFAGTVPINNSQYHLMSYQYNLTNALIYIDGNLDSNTLYSKGIYDSSAPLYIGRTIGLARNSYNGSIDEFTIYNRSLSTAEIGQIYSDSYPRFYPSGTQDLNQTIESGYNRVNITILNSNQPNTNLSLRVYNKTGWTDYTNMTNGITETFNISTNITNLNLSFLYNSDTNYYWSPILLNNINLVTWNETEGGEPPANDTCTYTSGNWSINLTDYCVITTNYELGGNNISFYGTGNITFNSQINATRIDGLPANQKGYLGSNAKIRVLK